MAYTHGICQNSDNIGYSSPNILKLNILSAVFGRADLTFEKFLKICNISFSTSVTFGNTAILNLAERTFSVIEETRYYPNEMGFHLGPYMRYKKGQYIKNDFFDFSQALVKTEISVIGFGFIVGYQWLVKQKLAINGFIGIGTDRFLSKKEIYNLDEFPDERTGNNSNIAYRLGISAGYKF